MSKILRLASAALVMTSSVHLASAQTVFRAFIENEQEVANPAVPEQGSGGLGTFILNNAQTQLSYDVTLFGLDLDGLQTPGNANDNVTRIHIHAAPAGSNGGIVFGMIDPSPAFQNDNNPNDLVVNPALGRITGVWNLPEGNNTTLAAQLPNLLANGLYFNVHTTDHPGGEVRGQIIQIPEPATLALAALAVTSLALARRRRD